MNESGLSPVSSTESLGSRLQAGIYFQSQDAPEPSYRLLLLDVKADTNAGEARAAIASLWAMLNELRIRDLAPDVRPDPPSSDPPPRSEGKLTCLIGFGARLFDRYPAMPRPEELRRLDDKPFRKIRWMVEEDRQPGEADIALQFIGRTELAVNRAVVEAWMLIAEQSLPLEIVTFHAGFNREDRRSWIGFHDGISNIESSQRAAVITVASQEPAWMEGGTYMAFLRVAIDLERWRRLPREHQELIVGRDKITGDPITGLSTTRASGCPMWGDHRFERNQINPRIPPALEPVLRASHMYRANPNRDGDGRGNIRDEDNRIFRQGYEFAEPLQGGRLRVGMNFVSFQRNLSRLTDMLMLDGWLGNVNFGGFSDQRKDSPPPITLLQLVAGGFYAVPPREGSDSFPGGIIF